MGEVVSADRSSLVYAAMAKTRPEKKQSQREVINGQVEQFLRDGGVIQTLPSPGDPRSLAGHYSDDSPH
jgi:hypothetical protein